MTKNVFQFRQFSVRHMASAMKVGTDGVLLGALATIEAPQRILDVGTGCGLIALILAQRTQSGEHSLQEDSPHAPARNEMSQTACVLVHAVEVDRPSANEARDNFALSPWADRLQIFPQRLQGFAATSSTDYDLIVCNPPFYDGSLPINPGRASARHVTSLTASDLLGAANQLLSDSGVLSVIVPYTRLAAYTAAAEAAELFLRRDVTIFPLPRRTPKRIVLEFAREPGPIRHERLVIQVAQHEFTADYRRLTSPFYLEQTFRRSKSSSTE